MRIDKLLSHTGFGTRKVVKQLLKNKAVEINEEIITQPSTHVNPETQVITVNGKIINYEKYIYLMLHKPAGVVSATFDNRDKTVLDLVPDTYSHYALSPIGRLDKDTEGLLLLSNDGQLNHLLTSPKNNIIKTYYAKIDGYVTNNHIHMFQSGVVLADGYKAKPAALRILKQDNMSEIEIDITEGKFHQVKRMFLSLDMSVLYLKRLKMGPIQLDQHLACSEIRSLTNNEIKYLQNIK